MNRPASGLCRHLPSRTSRRPARASAPAVGRPRSTWRCT